jgi:hypothetical protein
VERLSGNSLRGSDRKFLGSAKRPKWCPFVPFGRLVRPRNGAYSEFPDSLSTLDFSHLAARQSASVRFPWMPFRLFACRCRRSTRKKSPMPSQADIASSLKRQRRRSRRTGQDGGPRGRLSDSANGARSDGLALSGRLRAPSPRGDRGTS